MLNPLEPALESRTTTLILLIIKLHPSISIDYLIKYPSLVFTISSEIDDVELLVPSEDLFE